MKVYVVCTEDHSGYAVEVFTSEAMAREHIAEDIKQVCQIIEDDDFEWVRRDGNYFWEVYVPDSNIFYEWTLSETELRGEA